jgi:1,4-alpha-glucan branching enzyme
MVYGKRSLLQKMPGNSIHQKSKELRSLLGFMWAWPGKKTLFMGGEFGQSNEWNHRQSLDWHLLTYDDHSGIQRLVIDLNTLYRELPFLSLYDSDPCGFQWILCDDFENSVFAFLRQGIADEERLLVVGNFTPITREHYRIGVPLGGIWRCVLQTDDLSYGGNGHPVVLDGKMENIPCHGQRQSLVLTLSGTSVAFFRPLM